MRNPTIGRLAALCLIALTIVYTGATAQTIASADDPASTDTLFLPTGMTYAVDSLLVDWQVRSYVSTGDVCTTSELNPTFSDSVYIDRLSRMPTVMEMPFNEAVRTNIELYTGRLRNRVALMLGVANFYLPLFEEALDAYGLPLELKYLPVIESALNPSAVSRAGAVGLWQFIISTGKLYGLQSNSLVDDRRDPVKSTWAAARYLHDLYEIYHDWNLVIAAYNCGPGNINKAMRRAGGKTDYWEIYPYLPRETRNYVPAFIAANYVMTYYCHHNICPMVTSLPASTDTIHVDRELHFQQIADLCGVSMDELRSLNPQFKRNIIPGNSSTQTLRLPMAQLSTFIDRQDTIYNHRRAELFRNRRTVAAASPQRTTRRKATTGTGTRITHRIRSGETLSTIAREYGVTVADIQDWNGLSSTRITAGKTLIIYQ